MKIKNVIFDLDGTLLDTSRGIVESVKYTVETMGLRELTEAEYLSFIGPPLRKAFADVCGCSEEQAQEATVIFREYYRQGAVLHAEHYDGIEELCHKLRRQGMSIGVATNKPQRFADALIKEFGLGRYISAVFGANESGSLSKADLIRLCMEKLGGSTSDTVLIGDTVNDAAGAEQAGVFFLAVTYGFGFRGQQDTEGYPCIGAAGSASQILDILNKGGV